jgi:hypothetical protein
VQGMLKEGTKHMSGLEEATYKNIDAAKQLSSCVRTSLGPNGMNKMVRAALVCAARAATSRDACAAGRPVTRRAASLRGRRRQAPSALRPVTRLPLCRSSTTLRSSS